MIKRKDAEMLERVQEKIERLEEDGFMVRLVFSGNGKEQRMGQVTLFENEIEIWAQAFYSIDKLLEYMEEAEQEFCYLFFKLNWNNAPDWATYWAKDEDGKRYWYERKPEVDNVMGMWEMIGGKGHTEEDHINYPKDVNKLINRIGWKDSLRKRPRGE